MGCEACGGPLGYMGGLGQLHWYRCQDCGMEQSSDEGPELEEEEDEEEE